MSLYQRILVPIDGSATADHAIDEAIKLAADQSATLCVLHVLDDFPLYGEMAVTPGYQETLELLRKYGEETLAKAAHKAGLAKVKVETVQSEAVGRRVADVIVETAVAQKCQLIVIGTHGRRGFSRALLGSDAELVLREAPVPVLMIKYQAPAA